MVTNHDKKVREVANRFKRGGWNVTADLKGFPEPPTMYGKKADVVARKGKRTAIREIETPSSLQNDQDQIKAIKRYADLDPKRDFRVLIAKKKGGR